VMQRRGVSDCLRRPNPRTHGSPRVCHGESRLFHRAGEHRGRMQIRGVRSLTRQPGHPDLKRGADGPTDLLRAAV
jgi:hypothetical protein